MSAAGTPSEAGAPRKKLGFDFIWAGVARSSLVLAGFIATVLLTRLLQPAEVGQYFLIQSTVLVIGPLASLSLEYPAVRAIAAARALQDMGGAAAAARSALRLAILSSMAVALLCVCAWSLFAGPMDLAACPTP